VGASTRAGDALTLANDSAWLRLPLADVDLGSVSSALTRARPEPQGTDLALPRVFRRPARLVAERLGSTVLVSNLGAIQGPPELASAAIFPKAYGRSAVAIGAVTVGTTSTLTIRLRASEFDQLDAERLLADVGRELEGVAIGALV
jgi:hypothetical protein